MRRTIISLGVLGLVVAGGYGVFALAQRGRSCAVPTQPKATGTPGASDGAARASRGAVAGNFDPAMSGVCRFACATKLEYRAADVLAQPGAEPGKLTQCPVSGVVFVVDSERPAVRVMGHEYVACCGNCATKLQRQPDRYLRS